MQRIVDARIIYQIFTEMFNEIAQARTTSQSGVRVVPDKTLYRLYQWKQRITCALALDQGDLETIARQPLSPKGDSLSLP